METAAFVMGLAPLVALAGAVHSHIRALAHNDTYKKGLEQQASALIQALKSVPNTSSGEAAEVFEGTIRRKLLDVKQSLLSVTTSESGSSHFTRFFYATSYRNKLQNCQSTLEMLTLLVKAFIDEERRVHDTPAICNDLAEGPISGVGIDRTLPVREFLERSASQVLRVICMHGTPGLGKTTILKELWNKDARQSPFLVQAYVDVGDTGTGEDANDQSIRNLQTSILRQLGWANKIFSSSAFGRAELTKCFKQLKDYQKPFFLAIDNVLSPTALEILLPSTLAISRDSLLPSTYATEIMLPVKSCIALTCRDYRIVKSLLGICDLQEYNHLQVLSYNPPLLSDKAAMRLFVECARMQQQAREHQELLETLVPLCNGLPFALDILGKIFRNEDTRTHGKWQRIGKEMATMDGGEHYTNAIRKPLQLSYDTLSDSHKAAFLDMVELFYGWPWEVVECAVGATCMTSLKDRSLISQVDSFEQCNQGAVSQSAQSLNEYFYDSEYFGRQGHVSMHDLTFYFGKSIIDNNTIGYKRFINQAPTVSCLVNIAAGLRSFISATDAHDTELLSHLAEANNLQMLTVFSPKAPTSPTFAASCWEKSFSSQDGHGKLFYLMLGGLDGLDSSIMDKVSLGIRGIHLRDCSGIHSLSDALVLQELQTLRIDGCRRFEGFSKACVRQWHNLKEMILISCPAIVRIPAELGSLPSLQYVAIHDCCGLEEFPPLRGPYGPFELTFKNCPVLRCMGDVSCSLKKMHLSSCTSLEELPDVKTLKVLWMYFSPQLPSSIGRLTALEELDVLLKVPHNTCKQLQQLPSSICNLTALQKLVLTRCEMLVELPHNIGDLASLKILLLNHCKGGSNSYPAPSAGWRHSRNLIWKDVRGLRSFQRT